MEIIALVTFVGFAVASMVTVRLRAASKRRRLHSKAVVRVAGWGYGMVGDWHEKGSAALLQAADVAVQNARSRAGGGVVRVVITWDGDQNASDSFTGVLEDVWAALPEDTLFVAHRAACQLWKLDKASTGRKGFGFVLPDSCTERLWNDHTDLDSLPKHIRFLEVNMSPERLTDWSAFGLSALEWVRDVARVGNVVVVCLGGGEALAKEIESVKGGAVNGLEVDYIIVEGLSRRNKDGVLEFSSKSSLLHVERF